MKTKEIKEVEAKRWPVTILLIIIGIVILLPLYMAIVIAVKQPSEMTNNVAGALALPHTWSLSNFAEAIKITDFWHTVSNSLIITLGSAVACVLVSSMVSFAIARNMENKKIYRFFYYYLVSAMFVPFSMLMLPLVKQMAFFHLDNKLGVIFLYIVFNMSMNTCFMWDI